MHLQKKSLDLARAIRDSLANSWGVEQWRNPHAKPEPTTPRESS